MWRRKRISFFPDLITNPSTLRLSGGLFGSPRAREQKETAALYARVKTAFEQSRYADDADTAANRFADALIQEASNRAGGSPVLLLGEALWGLVHGLLAEDGLLFGFPKVSSFEQLSLQEGVALRSYLNRKEQFLAGGDPLYELWRRKVGLLMERILGHLPGSLLVDEGEVDASSRPTALSAPLIDLCHDPEFIVERALTAFFDEDVTQSGLFEPLRQRFNRNALLASGINPQNAEESIKPIVLPTETRGLSSEDLVERYCGGTSLAAFFQSRIPFEIPFPARFEHTHILGGSGHGKTQLMQSMIYEDLVRSGEDGRAVVVIDSQGDLIDTIAHLDRFAPGAESSLADRFVLVDPTDVSYPVCLNLFDWSGKDRPMSPVEREKLLNSAIGLYEYIFGALLGAELTQKQGVIFKYLARLMLEIPDATIHTLGALMENGEPFRPYMDRLTGSARNFFATRFFDRSFGETKKQILTRLWGVLSNSTLERIFGSPRNKVDIAAAIDSGKIILINTAKDLLTQDGAALFGRFFIALIAQAAVQRAAIPAHERRPCFVYIDEAADYFDDTVGHLLNQARKYKVGLILAHQNLDQLSTELRASLMASTSIKFAGGVSGKDARFLAEEMHCSAAFLQRMRKRKTETDFACFVRHFTPQAIAVAVPLGFMETQPKLEPRQYEQLVQRNRGAYCVPLDELIREQSGVPAAPAAPLPVPADQSASPAVASDGASAGVPQRQAQAPLVRESANTPTAPLRVASSPRTDVPRPMGRGGKQHQYVQQILKQAAEARGWRTIIEEPILEGSGRVDITLLRGSRRIACEISISSTRDQELANVEKCLAAGFAEVILIASSDRQRQMLEKYVNAALEEADRPKVRYLLAEEVIQYVASQEPPTEEMIRGYRVTVRQTNADMRDAEARRKAIAAVIARSLNR